MIDLPDGQKIVVGKMTQGSVIEVATWRGVGRPDSRTSRLMLGMGSGNVNEDSDAPEQGATQSQGTAPSQRAPQKPQGIKGYIATAEHFIGNFNRINWSATFKALLASLTSKKAKKAPKSAPTSAAPQSDLQVEPSVAPSITVSRASDDADIEAWLNKITEKAARETSKGRTTNSTSVKSAAKSKATVKKAAPKSSNARSSKKS